jgi:hypothetical protein
MPSKSNHSPGTAPVARAGFQPARNADKSDLHPLPPMTEADDLLLAAASAVGDDVVDDLADLDFDDPRFLVVDTPPSEEK